VLFFLFFFGLGGAKIATVAKLGGGFVVFFLGGKNRNFVIVRGRKLLLSLNLNHWAVEKNLKLLKLHHWS